MYKDSIDVKLDLRKVIVKNLKATGRQLSKKTGKEHTIQDIITHILEEKYTRKSKSS